MIGFKNLSASESNKRREVIISNLKDDKYKPEIELLYDWVTDKSFIDAVNNDNKESWNYCKNSMLSPPILYIEKQHGKCQNKFDYMHMIYPKPDRKKMNCRICNTIMATDVEKKIKYVVISCPCGRMYCHKKCADEYLMNEPQCYVCKNYYIYDFKNSSLSSTIANH